MPPNRRPTTLTFFYLATVCTDIFDKHTGLSYYFLSTCHQPRFLPGSLRFRFNTMGVFDYKSLCSSAPCLLLYPTTLLLTCHQCLVNHSIKPTLPFQLRCLYLLVAFSLQSTHQASDAIYYLHFMLTQDISYHLTILKFFILKIFVKISLKIIILLK